MTKYISSGSGYELHQKGLRMEGGTWRAEAAQRLTDTTPECQGAGSTKFLA
jgi:hypothetical protein